MLIKPYTQAVDASGHAIVTISHGLHGIQWKIYQVGFALGQSGGIPQVGALVNGQPLASTISLQPSVFGAIPGQPPFKLLSFMVGPPYILLKAGESMTCGLTGGTSGDTFTVTAYIDEFDADDPITMGN